MNSEITMSTTEARFQSEIDRNNEFLKKELGRLEYMTVTWCPEMAYEILKQVGHLSKAATIVQVYTQVLNTLKREGKEKTLTYLLDRVKRGARNPLRSTDPISNLQHTQELEYLSEALDILANY